MHHDRYSLLTLPFRDDIVVTGKGRIMINLIEERVEEIQADEDGFTTAELIGNAALGVAALAVIWGLIQTEVFPRLITFIETQLGI
jgi:hypothetical protein